MNDQELITRRPLLVPLFRLPPVQQPARTGPTTTLLVILTHWYPRVLATEPGKNSAGQHNRPQAKCSSAKSMALFGGEGEHEVQPAVHGLTYWDSGSSSMHAHWTVRCAPNPLLMGREDVLRDFASIIRDALANPRFQDLCRIVVTEMGRQHKSQICP